MWSKKGRFSTYSVRKITEWRDQQGFCDYVKGNPRLVSDFMVTGVPLVLGETYQLSIQTHPDIAGHAFAETAITRKDKGGVVYISKYGYYGDVIRHDEMDDLFEHISLLMRDCENLNKYEEDDESIDKDSKEDVPAPVPVPTTQVPVVPGQENDDEWKMVGKHGRVLRTAKK